MQPTGYGAIRDTYFQ
jgi:hypothetical protein